jgi:hypothetical protein
MNFCMVFHVMHNVVRVVTKEFLLQHSADQFERLLKEMCADDDGDLLIESSVKGIPKVFVVSTLVSAMPAQPYIFRNYQVIFTLHYWFIVSSSKCGLYSYMLGLFISQY